MRRYGGGKTVQFLDYLLIYYRNRFWIFNYLFVIECGGTSHHLFISQVTRIMEVEADSPYDVLGANHNMSSDNMKKKYVLSFASLSNKSFGLILFLN